MTVRLTNGGEDMSNLFDSILGMPVPFNMIVLIVLIASVAGVITSVAKETRRYFCHREEMELKREMLDRGMEGHQIEQVLRATTAHEEKPPE
jgi:cell division protein FtsL